MRPEIQNLLGQSLVLMLVAGVCLLAIRSLIREHRSSGSSCKGGCSGCGMDGICHSDAVENPLVSAYRQDHPVRHG